MKIILDSGDILTIEPNTNATSLAQGKTEKERDYISSDHLRGLCNMLNYLMAVVPYNKLSSEKRKEYYNALKHALERADYLEGIEKS
jgi:hypothetical protein